MTNKAWGRGVAGCRRDVRRLGMIIAAAGVPCAAMAQSAPVPPAAAPVPAAASGDTSATPAAPATPAELSTIDVTAGIQSAIAPTEGYVATISRGATKTDTPLIETPQAVNVITRAQIQDQGSQSINEVLRYTPGAYTGLAGASSRQDVVALRGFSAGDVNNTFLDGLRLQSDAGSYSNIQIDPFFLERVDVVKGPSSVLYGRAMPGGLVNYTTKRPQAEQAGLVRFFGGSFDTYGGGFDLTGALPEKRWGNYRIIGKADTSDTQYDVVERESYTLMPEVSLNLSDDTELLLQAYISDEPEGGFHGAVPYDISVNNNRFGRRVDSSWVDSSAKNEVFERQQQLVSYVLTHQVNEHVKLRSHSRYSSVDTDLEQVYQIGFAGDGPELSRYYSGANEDLSAFSTDNNAQFDFATGGVGHTLIAGFNFQRRNNSVVNFGNGDVTSLDPFDPDYSGNALGSEPFKSDDQQRSLSQFGIYLQDQMTWNRLHLVLSGREDFLDRRYVSDLNGNTDARADNAFSGRAAVLYESRIGLSPYFSYSEAFNPTTDTTVDGVVPEPVDSHQYEVGLKYQLPNTESLFTLALYDLTQQNVQQRVSVVNPVYQGVGDVSSQGVELTANAAVTDKLHVIAGYSYNSIEYDDSINTPGLTTEAGNTPVRTPDQLASLWVQYDFPLGIRGGLGGRYVGESYANGLNTRKVPDYAVADGFVSADLGEMARRLDGVHLRVNADNIFDKDYVSACFNETYCYFGQARRVIATLDYRF